MDFAHSAAARDTIERMTTFMNEHVIPAEKTYFEQLKRGEDWTQWNQPAVMEELKAKATSDLNTLNPAQVRAELRKAESGSAQHFLFKHRLASGEVRDVEVFSGPVDGWNADGDRVYSGDWAFGRLVSDQYAGSGDKAGFLKWQGGLHALKFHPSPPSPETGLSARTTSCSGIFPKT